MFDGRSTAYPTHYLFADPNCIVFFRSGGVLFIFPFLHFSFSTWLNWEIIRGQMYILKCDTLPKLQLPFKKDLRKTTGHD